MAKVAPLTATRVEVLLLSLIVVVYLLVGGLFAIQTPDWQTPDEPAHYNYIRQVVEDGCCPVIEMGDWDSAYLDELKAARFAPELLGDLELIQYEDHQPPLYYLLLSPVYASTGGSLTALRLASVVIGLVIVLCAYATGKALLPDRPQIALGAAAFVAFQPQHVAILASVNNDALGWSLVAVILWLSVAYVKRAVWVRPWMLGLLVGIALVTKSTAYLMAGIAFLAVILRWWTNPAAERPSGAALARALALYLVPALALGLIWWLRNFAVYGFPDFLGLAAHDAVVVGQPRTEALVSAVGLGGYLQQFARDTFNTFWGQFGWLGLPLIGGSVGWVYPAMLGLLIVGLLGLAVDRLVLRRSETIATVPGQRAAWLLLMLTVILSILAYLYYNTEFQQFQGRYMFPMLIPLGIALALGLDAWRRLLLGRWRVTRWLTPLFFFSFALLDVWLLRTVIVPNLTP
jgi:4-amino-4-deoxy-L-arabinose transferase-like glycosyltransferase